MPRPTAYPRIELCDTTYIQLNALGTKLTINAGASPRITSRGDTAVWVDVAYPGYGATLRLTLSRPRQLPPVIANRMQRIELNTAGRPTQVTQLQGHGVEGIVVESAGSGLTPIQLLATDNATFVLSGAVEMTDTTLTGSVEAARPIVDALRRDVTTLIQSL